MLPVATRLTSNQVNPAKSFSIPVARRHALFGDSSSVGFFGKEMHIQTLSLLPGIMFNVNYQLECFPG